MKKVIHMVTIARSLILMNGQIEYLKEKGFNVGVVSSPGKELDEQVADFKKSIKIERNINLLKDIKSLIKIINYFRKEKPDIVNSGTPKAGLLGILAAFISRVPTRVYTMRGLRLETEFGIKRTILWCTEKISCMLATEVICISASLLEKAKDLKLVGNKGIVLNKGSSNGLDISKYPLPDNKRVLKFKNEFMSNYNINKRDFIVGFVGRLSTDKGVVELIDVFRDLENTYDNIKLIILGDFEEDLDSKLITYIKNSPKIIYLGFMPDPTLYYYLFDVLALPTHREGFGNVSIQAQAASVPVITTNATGSKDTIINNKSGILYPVKSKDHLKLSILYFYKNPLICKKYGKNGRRFVEDNFQSKMIWEELTKLYKEISN